MSKPGISVIMPCHNYGRYIEEAVDSIVRQNREGVPMELIIVDDGSDDGLTASALDRIEHGQYPFPVKIVRNETASGGPSKPRNDAIKLAQYDYICPVDADDRFNSSPEVMKNGSYFARALADFEANPSLAIVYADMHPFTNKDGYIEKNTPWGTQPYDEDEMVRHGVIPAFGMFRRSDFEASGGYDDKLKSQEDWVHYLRILNGRMERGLPREVVQYSEEYLDYRQHDNNGEGTVKEQAHKGTPQEQLAKSKLLYQRLLANAPLLLREHYPNLNWEAKPDEIAEEIRDHSRDRFNAAASSNARTVGWYADWDRWNTEHPPKKKEEPGAQPAPVPQSPG